MAKGLKPWGGGGGGGGGGGDFAVSLNIDSWRKLWLESSER